METGEQTIANAGYDDPSRPYGHRTISGIRVCGVSGHDVFVTEGGTFFVEIVGKIFKAKSLNALSNRIEGVLSPDIHGVEDMEVVFLQGDSNGTHVVSGQLTGGIRQRSKAHYYEVLVDGDRTVHVQANKLYRADSVDVEAVKRLHTASVMAGYRFEEAWSPRKELFRRDGRILL